MRVEHFPAPGSKAQASQFLITTGGQGANAAIAAARLGARTSYAGPLGSRDDEVANRIVATLEHEGIDCRHAVRVPGGMSSVSLIMIDCRRREDDRDAARHESERRRADRCRRSASPTSMPCCSTTAIPISSRRSRAKRARAASRACSISTAPEPLDDPLLQLCTHVIASADALRASAGESDLAAALEKLGTFYGGFLAVTDGAQGMYWLDSGAIRHMDAFRVEAIDTLGAGDAFHGAFTVRLVETGDAIEAMRFAAAAAAIKCTRFGGLMGAATRAEVEAFLRARTG